MGKFMNKNDKNLKIKIKGKTEGDRESVIEAGDIINGAFEEFPQFFRDLKVDWFCNDCTAGGKNITYAQASKEAKEHDDKMIKSGQEHKVHIRLSGSFDGGM